jgi:hypothetical protein
MNDMRKLMEAASILDEEARDFGQLPEEYHATANAVLNLDPLALSAPLGAAHRKLNAELGTTRSDRLVLRLSIYLDKQPEEFFNTGDLKELSRRLRISGGRGDVAKQRKIEHALGALADASVNNVPLSDEDRQLVNDLLAQKK